MQEIQIKPWYKMTELWVIPVDWEEKKLWEIASIKMGQSPKSEFYNIIWQWMPLVQWNADIKNRKTIIRHYTSQITKIWQKWDIIMTIRAPVWYIAKLQFDSCLWRWVCSLTFNNNYLYHYLINLEKYWKKLSTGSTFDSVNSAIVKTLIIHIPTFIEQKAIAEVLSNTDELINSLDELIEKKEKIKEWTMQELLTWKRRLPWFSGDWEKKKLGGDLKNLLRIVLKN